MKEKIDFIEHNERNWGDKQAEMSKTLCKFLAEKKSFSISFTHMKTPKQLRAYWRLIDLITPFMIENYGEIDSREDVSIFVKLQCNFSKKITHKNGEMIIAKSTSEADKKMLSELIDKLLFMCENIGIKNYELSNEEKTYIN